MVPITSIIHSSTDYLINSFKSHPTYQYVHLPAIVFFFFGHKNTASLNKYANQSSHK